MKIVFILPGTGRSGGIRNTVVAANHLLARGHKVRIFYQKNSTICFMLRSIRNKLMYPGRYNWLEMFEGECIGFEEITNCEFRHDEMIVGVGMWSSAELVKLSGINNPKLQYLRGMTPWMQQKMDEALSLNIPKVVVSSHDRDYITSRYKGNVLDIIPNGVNPDDYYLAVHENDQKGVGAMYALHTTKDPKTMLALFSRLKERLPDVPQYIFGKGPKPKEIPKINYTRFPSIERARQIYSSCKVWVLTSRSEGFGMPILEAMACGCAVVATDCGGPSDIIEDGENGFCVEVGNVDQLFDRVKMLLTDDKLREKFVMRSKETVKKFNWKHSIAKLEKVLLSLSNSNI